MKYFRARPILLLLALISAMTIADVAKAEDDGFKTGDYVQGISYYLGGLAGKEFRHGDVIEVTRKSLLIIDKKDGEQHYINRKSAKHLDRPPPRLSAIAPPKEAPHPVSPMSAATQMSAPAPVSAAAPTLQASHFIGTDGTIVERRKKLLNEEIDNHQYVSDGADAGPVADAAVARIKQESAPKLKTAAREILTHLKGYQVAISYQQVIGHEAVTVPKAYGEKLNIYGRSPESYQGLTMRPDVMTGTPDEIAAFLLSPEAQGIVKLEASSLGIPVANVAAMSEDAHLLANLEAQLCNKQPNAGN